MEVWGLEKVATRGFGPLTKALCVGITIFVLLYQFTALRVYMLLIYYEQF